MDIGDHWTLRHYLTRPHEYPTIIAHLIDGDFNPNITTRLQQLLHAHLTPTQDRALTCWL